MTDETDRSHKKQDKFVGRVRTKGYDLSRVSRRELFYGQASKKRSKQGANAATAGSVRIGAALFDFLRN